MLFRSPYHYIPWHVFESSNYRPKWRSLQVFVTQETLDLSQYSFRHEHVLAQSNRWLAPCTEPCDLKSNCKLIEISLPRKEESLNSLRIITMGNRRRQKLLAEMFVALLRSHLVGIKPSWYNFSRSSALISVLNGSLASTSLIFDANSRIWRDNLLYLKTMENHL